MINERSMADMETKLFSLSVSVDNSLEISHLSRIHVAETFDDILFTKFNLDVDLKTVDITASASTSLDGAKLAQLTVPSSASNQSAS